jgi:hypothetical protein
MIVYNNGSGVTPVSGSGTGNQRVVPGSFYYFSNPGSQFNTDSGKWLAVGSGPSTATFILDGVAVDTHAIINVVQEKVVRLASVAADGVNATLDLDAALSAATVVVAKFRKAVIYDAAGDLVMEATGGYTTDTDILVTGNGMMNLVLPAANYSVEVYYTE